MVSVIGIFFVLHGLVHFLYFGQTARFFELQPDMIWPDNAWLFTPFFRKKAIRVLAGNFCILSGMGFIVSALAVFLHHSTWYILAMSSSVFSSFGYVFFLEREARKIARSGCNCNNNKYSSYYKYWGFTLASV